MVSVHVVPRGDRWKVDLVESFATQEEAIEVARSISRERQGELVIHGEDGQIREKDSHGNDPGDIPG